jgi:hypothetical protein
VRPVRPWRRECDDGQQLLLDVAQGQRPLLLQRRDRVDGVCAAEVNTLDPRADLIDRVKRGVRTDPSMIDCGVSHATHGTNHSVQVTNLAVDLGETQKRGLGLGIWGLTASRKSGEHGRGRAIFVVVVGTRATPVSIAVVLQAV